MIGKIIPGICRMCTTDTRAGSLPYIHLHQEAVVISKVKAYDSDEGDDICRCCSLVKSAHG